MRRIDREAYLATRFYEYVTDKVMDADAFSIRLYPYDFVMKCKSEAMLWHGLVEAIRFQRNVR